jgi:hypothetical protein
MKIIKVCTASFVLMSMLSACKVKHNSVVKNVAPDVSAIKVKLQDKKVYAFDKAGVSFSNNFDAARLNKLVSLNDSTFNIEILPENEPINPSPWFAFKVWGKPSKNVYINLVYPTAKHRYPPKIVNAKGWKLINNVKLSKDRNEASFVLQLTKDTALVAGQEVVPSSETYRWISEVAPKYQLKTTTIGYSIGGKPIVALSSQKSSGKKMVLVISRQHPPEVTGYMAMLPFVETLLGNSDLAKRFNENYELVIVPLMNPDGVDQGNWRHSFGGVDLNRDWEFFKQPETKSFKDFILKKIESQDAKVEFALDFHSTYNDVMYTNTDRNDTNRPGLMAAWIEGLHSFEKANSKSVTPIKPSPNGGNTSKSWFGRALNAEAVTYEVGDSTPRDFLHKKAVVCAEVLMTELLKK